MARCITRDASVFLVDEPFANLDQALREKYRVNLRALLRQFNITTVYVTHDHHEALVLAHLLAVMNRGTIEQIGTPRDIYDRPKNLFVAGFLNVHAGTPPLSLVDPHGMPGVEGNVWVGVRPEDVGISREAKADRFRGTLTDVVDLPLGTTRLVTVRVADRDVYVATPADESAAIGATVWLAFKRYHVFDKESGLRLRSHAAANQRSSQTSCMRP